MDTAQLIARVSTSTGSGSGHVIAPRLVLTSAHVTPEVGGQVWVHTAADHRSHTGHVVWRGTPHGHDDAALVEVTDPDWVEHATTTRWGRLVTTTPGTGCEVWGFPYLVQREGRAAETAQLSGTVAPGNHYVNHRHMMELSAHPPRWNPHEIREQEEAGQRRSLWAGLSGAAMRCGEGRLLVGVVAADLDHRDHAALEVVPVYVLHHDPGFRAVLAEHDVSLTLEPVELAHLTHTATYRRPSPASLLEARRQVVNFHGREETMRTLLEWCEDEEPLSAVVVHGPGGQGKTRLGYELTEHLTRPDEGGRRWATVWLTGTATVEELAPIEKTTTPLLVVVDYAEARTSHLIRLLQLCDRPPGSPPVRLLLLVRTVGEWWEQVNTATDFLLADIARQLALPPLAPHTVERAREYRSALRQLAQALPSVRTPRPADWGRVAADLPDPDLSGSEWTTVLSVHMRALADLLDATQPATTVTVDTAVEGRVLAHEFRYWEQTAEAFGLGDAELAQSLRDVLALAFALTPADMEDADRLLAEATGLEGQSTAIKHRIRLWIGGLYPTDGSGLWGYLQPDRLLEYFLGQRLKRDPHLLDVHVEGIAEADAVRLLTLYSHAAAHPALVGLEEHLIALCTRHVDAMGPAIIDVATQVESPGPLLRTLDDVTAAHETSLKTLKRLNAALPGGSQRLVERAERLSERWVRALLEKADQERRVHVPDLIIALNSHANHLSELGHDEEALGTINRAVTFARALTERNPGAHHLSNLAVALHSHANRLRALGRFEEALSTITEATLLLRPLSEQYPDLHLPVLAKVLRSYTDSLVGLGRFEEALSTITEATLLLRPLAVQRPDTHLPSLAGHLITQANCLGVLGRCEEALDANTEAIAILRPLAVQRPDTHPPALAVALCGQANLLNALERFEEALDANTEAIAILRPLAVQRPDTHPPALASGLITQADCLGSLGRFKEALGAITEVVAILRPLTEQRPDTRLPSLATALDKQAILLGRLGRFKEALDANTEVVAILRPLAQQHPDIHSSGLVRALNRQNEQLRILAQYKEALEAITEIIPFYREIAAQSLASQLDLAGALHEQALYLYGLGRPMEAFAPVTQAIEIWKALRERHPTMYQEALEHSLWLLDQLRRE
ncbi:hypothetical protein ACIQFP_01900 [Nocardiopsis alba]|uniref:hypothetical protein n=1 Tax=Nocardiopsis alba TaxID=53437 RepID=UPI00380E343E